MKPGWRPSTSTGTTISLRRVPLSAVEKRDRVVDERRLVRRRKAEDAVDDVVQERLLAIRPVRRLDDRDVGRPREVRAARRHRPAAGRVPRPERDRGVAADAGTVRRRAHAKGALHLCGNQNFTARSESSRRPPRHRCDACSMAWRCRSLAARRSQDGTRSTVLISTQRSTPRARHSSEKRSSSSRVLRASSRTTASLMSASEDAREFPSRRRRKMTAPSVSPVSSSVDAPEPTTNRSAASALACAEICVYRPPRRPLISRG